MRTGDKNQSCGKICFKFTTYRYKTRIIVLTLFTVISFGLQYNFLKIQCFGNTVGKHMLIESMFLRHIRMSSIWLSSIFRQYYRPKFYCSYSYVYSKINKFTLVSATNQLTTFFPFIFHMDYGPVRVLQKNFQTGTTDSSGRTWMTANTNDHHVMQN